MVAAADLLDAEALLQEDRAEDALLAFEEILAKEPESIEAAVGSAIARWPAGTTARLRTLALSNEQSALVHLHHGFALFWEGREQGAVTAWQEAILVEPDSPAALRAENLLFPETPRGRPIFVPSVELDADLRGRPLSEQLAALEASYRDTPSARSAIAYGVALQRAGRASSARDRFADAARLEPDNAEARTAAAVGLYDKADPTPAFAALGQLTTTFPDAAVVRYHLALALIWFGDVAEARNQLVKAAELDGEAFYQAQAARLLERLSEVDPVESGATEEDGPS